MDREKETSDIHAPFVPTASPNAQILDSAKTDSNGPEEFELDAHNTFSQENGQGKKRKAKPDLSALMNETFSEEKKGRKDSSALVNYGLVFIILILFGVIFWQFSLQRALNDIARNQEVLVTDATLEVTPTVLTTDPVFSVISPEEFQEVGGGIEFNLKAENVSAVSLKAFDDNGLQIGEKLAVDATSGSITGSVDVTDSPTTSEGYLIIYPADKDHNSAEAETISITFRKTFRVDKMNLKGPINGQLITTNSLRFVGELKNFEGNKFKFILRDDNSREVSSGVVSSANETSSSEYVKFDQTVDLGSIPTSVTDAGRIDVYDATGDVNASPLLTLPIRFR